MSTKIQTLKKQKCGICYANKQSREKIASKTATQILQFSKLSGGLAIHTYIFYFQQLHTYNRYMYVYLRVCVCMTVLPGCTTILSSFIYVRIIVFICYCSFIPSRGFSLQQFCFAIPFNCVAFLLPLLCKVYEKKQKNICQRMSN